MTAGLRILAVDDERPALDDLARILEGSELVARVDRAGSAREALLDLGRAPYDALFLDVRMPGLDGVQLARVLARFAHPPALVFVSAYETAAVEAFELHALDYVMKPAGRARIAEALSRVAAARAGAGAGEQPTAGAPGVIAVDDLRGGTRLLARSSILYVEARGDYVRVVADGGRFVLRASLRDLEERWAPLGFVRVHRSYVVNLRRAAQLRPLHNGTAVLHLDGGARVPVARRKAGELHRLLRASTGV